jgi:hypothetical protein
MILYAALVSVNILIQIRDSLKISFGLKAEHDI